MNTQQILHQLKDIHAPKAISMWPATTAWYLVFFIIVILCGFIFYRIFKFYKKKQNYKKVDTLFANALNDYTNNPAKSIEVLSVLIRKVCLMKFSRSEVAYLQNEAWLKFLDTHINSNDFSEGVGRALITAPYQKDPQVDILALEKLLQRWLKAVLS